MEKAKEERKWARRSFTMSANQLENFLAAKDKTNICATYDKLSQLYVNLSDLQNKVFSAWLNQSDRDESAYEKDFEESESYTSRWFLLKQKVKEVITNPESTSSGKASAKEFGSCGGISCRSAANQRQFKLPRLELPKFDGQISGWIAFWAQFKKVHNDQDLDVDDKFQYLLQCMERGSSARELVESFPPTGSNYASAIAQLKSRFGRDEVIIEHYVRELLQLVLAQAKGTLKPSVRTLYDKLMAQILALESLGVTQDKYAAFLFPLVESALPSEILRAWTRSPLHTSTKANPLNELLIFVRQEVESEERIRIAHTSFRDEVHGMLAEPTAACLTTTAPGKKFEKSKSTELKVEKQCLWCDKSSHNSSECIVAVKKTLDERRDFLKRKNACYICLNIGHIWKKCKKHPQCVICGKRHYPIMCNGLTKEAQNNDSSGTSNNQQTVVNQSTCKDILLQTLKVNICNGEDVLCVRALLDTGAQQSFIKKEVVEKLNLKPSYQKQISHNLFGGVVTKKQNYDIYDIKVKALDGKYKCSIEALEEEKICGHLPKLQKGSIIISKLLSKGVNITDCVNDVSEISLLIGCDISGSLYTGRSVRLEDNLLAVETMLGWTVQGPVVGVYCAVGNVNSLACSFDVEDIWKLETIGIQDDSEVKSRKTMESQVDVFFKNTVRFNEEQRYEVKLPWKDSVVELNSNFSIALKRLYSTTAKLSQLGIMKEYSDTFLEWKESGIIEEVFDADTEKGYYLPHHAVVKESSLTTKIRPVFDASSSKKGEFSLNQCLEKGTNLIDLIPPLIIKFRKNAIGITSDIKKAFLQISLDSGDRDYLKFLWWRNFNANDKDINTFRHRRVVFGVTTSPYLLSATILHHLENYEGHTADVLRNSFYVDNCITSVSTVQDMHQFIAEAKAIMLEGNFELRCWVTGPELIDKDIKTISVLGLNWQPESDELFCKLPLIEKIEAPLSKRSIMSIAHSIFDPIGFVCPTMLIPKLIIQKCWILKQDWDRRIPEELEETMNKWIAQLKILELCKIPRRISHADLGHSENSIHVFSDASQSAYAACIFLRSEFDNEVSVQLLSAKSRVAPTKAVTMPRLELLAALLAARLSSEVENGLTLNCKKNYWTDSSIALAWIKRDVSLQMFVHNRVKEIRQRSDVEAWRHLPGVLNPADLPSRGCYPEELIKSRWWEGPEWLRFPQSEWPQTNSAPDLDESEFRKEVKKTCLVVQNSESFAERFTYFGRYTKIVRTAAWCLRFFTNCNSKSQQRGDITTEEFMKAEKRLFRIIQLENFQPENFKTDLKLKTFQDGDDLIRVRTRLTLSSNTDMFISPVLLPSKNKIVERLVVQKHYECHAGSQTLINLLRERFWIIGIRCLAKKTVRQCPMCRRYVAKPCTVPPAPLPVDRIQCGSVFEVTGIDLAGPLFLRDGSKCWIVLFTCATYRAVHLELCTSISTEEFLQSLRRFLARRGAVKTIYSDNGTNFCGANNLLKHIDWQEVSSKTTMDRIIWRHIPPAAPWWGGFWERMIRSLKDILKRILGKSALRYTELLTVLCQAEALLNSRPLTYVSEDTENFRALTPAMFLKVDALNQEGLNTTLDNLDGNVLTSRWKYLVKLNKDLKERFRSEYLALLTQRYGNDKVQNRVNVGDVVLISSDDVKRVNWPLGLVVEIFPGVDGESRVARLKTALGEKVRPFQRLFPLEVRAAQASSTVQPNDASRQASKVFTRTGRLVKVPDRLNL